MPNRRQAIIWTNTDPIHWRIYAALGEDELRLPAGDMFLAVDLLPPAAAAPAIAPSGSPPPVAPSAHSSSGDCVRGNPSISSTACCSSGTSSWTGMLTWTKQLKQNSNLCKKKLHFYQILGIFPLAKYLKSGKILKILIRCIWSSASKACHMVEGQQSRYLPLVLHWLAVSLTCHTMSSIHHERTAQLPGKWKKHGISDA